MSNNSNPNPNHPIRVLLPHDLYQRLKAQCQDHGDLSKLIRQLLIKHLKGLEVNN